MTIPETLGFDREKYFRSGGNDVLQVNFGPIVGYVWGFGDEARTIHAFLEIMPQPERGVRDEEHWSSIGEELAEADLRTHDPFTLKVILMSLLEHPKVIKYLRKKLLDTVEQP